MTKLAIFYLECVHVLHQFIRLTNFTTELELGCINIFQHIEYTVIYCHQVDLLDFLKESPQYMLEISIALVSEDKRETNQNLCSKLL